MSTTFRQTAALCGQTLSSNEGQVRDMFPDGDVDGCSGVSVSGFVCELTLEVCVKLGSVNVPVSRDGTLIIVTPCQ